MAFWSALLDRLRGAPQEKAISSADLYLLLANQQTTTSGVRVDWKTALQASVALACGRVIAEGLSQVPFRLMRMTGDTRSPAADHPLYDLVEWQPNPWQTSTDMIDQIGIHLAFLGNAYVWLNRARGVVQEMFPWPPNMVETKLDGMDVRYTLTLHDGRRLEVPARDIWHIKGPSWEGWIGLDVVNLAREAIGLSLSAEKSVSATMANGAKLSGLLSTDANLSKEQRQLMRESWQESQAGAANAGKVAVLSNGMKFTAMQSTAVDAQQVENRKFAVEEICRAFRVMPIMVGYSDKTSTYASAEQMFQAHVTHTLGPWYRRIERSAAVSLLTKQERDAGMYFKFFTQGLLRGSTKDRADFYQSLYSIGALNPNEIRDFEDMNPYEGGEKYRVPLNMADPKVADDMLEDGSEADPEQDDPADEEDDANG
jgi:HK97 family phage portal protein